MINLQVLENKKIDFKLLTPNVARVYSVFVHNQKPNKNQSTLKRK